MAVADPCAGLELLQAVAEAEADVQAHRVDTYEQHAQTLEQARVCRETPGDPDGELDVAGVLAAMAEDAVARGSIDRGHALAVKAREVYAAVAERTDDPTLARTAAEAQLELVTRVFGELPASRNPPRSQGCHVDSRGYCAVPRPRRGAPDRDPELVQTPYDEVERVQLAAHEVYEAHAAPGELLRSRRYRRLETLMRHHDYATAVPGLEHYILDYDGHRSAVWAAMMLLDALVNQLFVFEDDGAHEPLMRWTERLPTLSLWLDDDSANGLHERVPVIRASLMWMTAVRARDEGAAADQALHDASRDHTGVRPEPEEPFLRCAAIFLEIHDAFPDHDRADTLLWNAADCYDAAWRPMMATAARQRLLLEYPQSEHAQYALRTIVENEQALARFESAAAHGLEFARRYPKDFEASEMLLRALPIQDALGHSTNAAEIVDLYTKAYSRKDPQRVAQMVWSRRPEEPEALLAYAEDFVRKTRSWPAGKVDALRVIHELRWARACEHRIVDGLCVARVEPRPSSACTLSGTPMPLVRARGRRRAEEATVAVKRTLAVLRMSTSDGSPRLVRRARASAGFHALEPELEGYLQDGPLAADVLARVEALDRGYAEVAAIGDVELAIAAHARRALAWEGLANQHLVRHLVRREGRCTPSSPEGETLVARATQAYRDCLALAVKTQQLDDTARRCERALAFIEPAAVPPLHEFVPSPTASGAPTMTAVGVVTDPWSQP